MQTTSATRLRRRQAHRDAELKDASAAFTDVQRRLYGIAHRIVGNAADAEDIVQDAWIRWQTCDRRNVRNSTAFLVTMTTRLAINAAKSARVRHESYVGEWLPEPTDPRDDPAHEVEQVEVLGQGIQILLERLSPAERAAFVLRHAFGYPYPAIAHILGMTETNTRQLVSRAGKHLAAERHRATASNDRGRLLQAFMTAANGGDVAELEQVLAA
jgi:RNA polymerase sigma-70 factor (ECF subfamily)